MNYSILLTLINLYLSGYSYNSNELASSWAFHSPWFKKMFQKGQRLITQHPEILTLCTGKGPETSKCVFDKAGMNNEDSIFLSNFLMVIESSITKKTPLYKTFKINKQGSNCVLNCADLSEPSDALNCVVKCAKDNRFYVSVSNYVFSKEDYDQVELKKYIGLA